MSGELFAGIAFAGLTFGSMIVAWLVPGFVKGIFVARQNELLEQIRSAYLTGRAAWEQGDETAARAELAEIMRLEERFARRNSWQFRSLVAICGFVASVCSYLVFRAAGFAVLSSVASLQDILSGSNLLILALLAAAHGVAGVYHGDVWFNSFEPMNLSDNLRRAIDAGRAVSPPRRARKGSHRIYELAKDVFGLSPVFTRRELDSARRRLALKNHPDVWMTAPAEVRRAKEGAMKHINEAYEVLLPHAS